MKTRATIVGKFYRGSIKSKFINQAIRIKALVQFFPDIGQFMLCEWQYLGLYGHRRLMGAATLQGLEEHGFNWITSVLVGEEIISLKYMQLVGPIETLVD